MERYTESYVNEMRAFVECIVHDTLPPVTGLDGRIPVVMGFAAERSLAEGRPVRLDEAEA
jgi:myo-inositol 2-dehydrogenase/D-chiro-inositol 1-dehydrogenase